MSFSPKRPWVLHSLCLKTKSSPENKLKLAFWSSHVEENHNTPAYPQLTRCVIDAIMDHQAPAHPPADHKLQELIQTRLAKEPHPLSHPTKLNTVQNANPQNWELIEATVFWSGVLSRTINWYLIGLLGVLNETLHMKWCLT